MTATFYDTRSERRVAAALAEEHKAAAAERLAAAEAARAASQVETKARGALLAEQAKERARERREERRAARVAARRARTAEVRAAVSASLPSLGMSALWASVIVAPLLLAWNAQMKFAVDSLGIQPGLSWLFPLAIECGAWACAFEAHRRTRVGRPVGSLPVWMWVLAGIAAGINFVHGITGPHGVAAGLALAAVSVLGVLLHHIRQSLDRATDDPAARLAEARKRTARLVLHPILSVRACSISARTGTTSAEAWEAAHRDRYGVGPAASKRDRRLGRVIARRQWKADRKAAKDGGFVIVNGVILALPDTLTPHPVVGAEFEPETDEWVDPWEKFETTEAAPEPTASEAATSLSTAETGPELTPRVAALLARTRAAVAAGELPARPSAHAIRKHFGGGSDTAQTVRNILANPTASPLTDSEGQAA